MFNKKMKQEIKELSARIKELENDVSNHNEYFAIKDVTEEIKNLKDKYKQNIYLEHYEKYNPLGEYYNCNYIKIDDTTFFCGSGNFSKFLKEFRNKKYDIEKEIKLFIYENLYSIKTKTKKPKSTKKTK